MRPPHPIMFLILFGIAVFGHPGRAQGQAATTTPLEISRGPLCLRLDPATHAYAVTDQRTGRIWSGQAPAGQFTTRRAQRTAEEALTLDFHENATNLDYRCVIRIEPEDGVTSPTASPATSPAQAAQSAQPSMAAAGISFQIEAATPNAKFGEIAYPPALHADLARPMLLFCDRAGGNYVPLDDPLFVKQRLFVYINTDALDMPWIGVVDDVKGDGLMFLFETPWECFSRPAHDTPGLNWPQPVWFATKDIFGYARRGSWHFTAAGGYVAQAKTFRRWAEANGLVKTLAQKIAERPRVAWLKGALDVWGADGLRFAREAQAAGVRHALINGRFRPDEMQALTRMECLTGEYDNYSDILDGPLGVTHDNVAAVGIHLADGKIAGGWEDKSGAKFSVRSTVLALDAAKKLIPPILARYPYTARFLDVQSTMQFFEDWSTTHPMTRREDMQYRLGLYGYINSLGLVTGGEHGKAWGVPVLDYVEGMMSGPFWWQGDGGYLRPYKTREAIPKDFVNYGLNPAVRIPLWELVYHDSVVTTWYWGDTNGWTWNVAPELCDRKDLFNILYGTLPMDWVNNLGYGWDRNRDRLLQAYYTISPVQARVFGQLMASHEFLSADRLVQRTKFADGTVATVNFGEQPWPGQRADGTTVTLAPCGWWVEAPGLRHSREWVDGAPLTRIESADFYFLQTAPGRTASAGPIKGSGMMAAFMKDGAWRVRLGASASGVVDARQLCGLKTGEPFRIVELRDDGRMKGIIAAGDAAAGDAATSGSVTTEGATVNLPAGLQARLFAILTGAAARKPLLMPEGGRITAGETVTIAGGEPATQYHYTLDGSEPGSNSLRYAGPLALQHGAVLTARAFNAQSGAPLGDVIKGVYEVEHVLATTPVLRSGDPPARIEAALTGWDELEVRVGDGGDGDRYDASLLAAPCLLSADGATTADLTAQPMLWSVQYGGEPEALKPQDNPIPLAGRNFARGVRCNSNGRYAYAIDGRWAKLEALAGVPDWSQRQEDIGLIKGSVQYTVVGISRPSGIPF